MRCVFSPTCMRLAFSGSLTSSGQAPCGCARSRSTPTAGRPIRSRLSEEYMPQPDRTDRRTRSSTIAVMSFIVAGCSWLAIGDGVEVDGHTVAPWAFGAAAGSQERGGAAELSAILTTQHGKCAKNSSQNGRLAPNPRPRTTPGARAAKSRIYAVQDVRRQMVRCRFRFPDRLTDGAGGFFRIWSTRSMSFLASAAVMSRPIASAGMRSASSGSIRCPSTKWAPTPGISMKSAMKGPFHE
jgi:hypothetical protein